MCHLLQNETILPRAMVPLENHFVILTSKGQLLKLPIDNFKMPINEKPYLTFNSTLDLQQWQSQIFNFSSENYNFFISDQYQVVAKSISDNQNFHLLNFTNQNVSTKYFPNENFENNLKCIISDPANGMALGFNTTFVGDQISLCFNFKLELTNLNIEIIKL